MGETGQNHRQHGRGVREIELPSPRLKADSTHCCADRLALADAEADLAALVGDLARAALDGDERVDRRLAVARNHPELAKLSLTGRRKGRDKRGSEHDGESGMAHVINSLHHRRSESTGHPEP